MVNNEVMRVKDVMEMFGFKQSKAYGIIRQLNEELEDKGFLTVSGRVPAAYLMKRMGISLHDDRAAVTDV